MVFALFDRVKETSATTGTGALSLAGAVSQFIAFSSVYSNGDTFDYCITDQTGTNWEVGLGTYTSAGNLLTRTTVKASSNAGSAVNFTSGALYAFVTLAAYDAPTVTNTNVWVASQVFENSPQSIVAQFRSAGASGITMYPNVMVLSPASVVSVNSQYFSNNQNLNSSLNCTTGFIFGFGRTGNGAAFGNDTYSPSTAVNVAAANFQTIFTPSGSSGSYAAVEINPTINGTSSGKATALAIASITNTLSGGTINLLDIGTTTTDYFTGYTSKMRVNLSGNFVTYGAVATAGLGVPAIYGYGRATAQAAANASVATYTVGAADGSFDVCANVLVTTSTLHNFTVTVAYTDEGNTPRVLTLQFSNLAGTFLTAIANAAGAVPYEGVAVSIRCKASTTITIASAAGGTYTTVVYNIEGFITQKA